MIHELIAMVSVAASTTEPQSTTTGGELPFVAVESDPIADVTESTSDASTTQSGCACSTQALEAASISSATVSESCEVTCDGGLQMAIFSFEEEYWGYAIVS